MKPTVCVVVLGGILLGVPLGLRAQTPEGEMQCPDECIWKPGYGSICDPGSQGCKCQEQGGACIIYNCGGPVCGDVEEEDEEAVAGGAGLETGLAVHVVQVAGELYVAVDGCASGPMFMARLDAHTPIEIVQPLRRESRVR